MNLIDTLFILFAKYLIVLSVVIAIWYFLKQPRDIKKRLAAFGILSLVIIGVLALIAGHVYYNPRPFVVEHFTPLISHDASNGFPSDHVLLAAALAAIVFFFGKKWGSVLLVLSILLGISRMYVGVHHLIDIIGSIVIAFVGAYLAHVILHQIRKRRTVAIQKDVQ